jgi:predicted AAA+ superfamily ATPase
MAIDWDNTWAAVWRQHKQILHPVRHVDEISLESLIGIERQKQELVTNTERFLDGKPANNALLWGARGTGKSSLIKALLNTYKIRDLRLIEVFKSDLYHLPEIVDGIRDLPQRFIIYSDDFSFEVNDNSYIGLKTLLEGSIEQPPSNVKLYATSNRRHLVPESMQDNLDSKVIDGELHYADAIEEKISLSDRFGLWLSFYQPDKEGYLKIVDSYFPDYAGDKAELHKAAWDFASLRGAKSGRTAKQFFNYFSAAEK